MLYKFVEGYTADYTAKKRCIALYTDTRCVTALHSYTATIQLNSAIQRCTLYSYTALYTINTTSTTPLWCARRVANLCHLNTPHTTLVASLHS